MFSAGAGVFFPEPEFFLPEPEAKNPEFAQHYTLRALAQVRMAIKGLKETTHGYKKNQTKRMISRANCNTMFLFFLTADNQISRNVHS